jgi:serine/threonine protein kinase/tetratricopeptide (TPR) repeat protein
MPPISPERWRALSPYLDEALEIEAAGQAAWLESIAARDPALADDLRSILAGHKAVHDSGFLEGVVVDPRLTFVPSLAGQVLGSYRLISPIGQGGSGNVWLAERCDGRFQGRAAVKLLNIALVERGGEARFKREGTILAGLRHPHIAHLIDAGISQTGQPYLVLEHVDGRPIDQYCESAAVPVEGRIRLFLDVLNAVAYAHASLVVHRDIKPANVLVSKEGGVKLLDFGIAKLIERDAPRRSSADSNAFARDGGSALTPQYAAPEQLSGGEITTATDIYALGVLLYVLLSGRHPAGDGADTPAKLLRAIVELEAPKLTEAVGPGADPQRVVRHAAECATTPAKLRRALAGDLEAIVGKALRKNPAERYASVAAFADDLRRHLQDEPVVARQQTLSYRTARFVRRHPGGVSATAAAVLLVAGLTGVYTGRLAAQRNRAQREAAKAIKVSELMMGLLTSADPYLIRGAEGQPTSVRAVLDAGAAQVQKELAGEPELQVEMLTAMGRTYRRLAAFDKAQQLLEQALASGRQVFGGEHIQVAQTLDHLGVVLADKGEYRAAGQRLEEALAMRRKLLGPQHPDVAVTLAELGRVYQDQGLNQRAEPLHREALEIRRKVLGAAHRETAVSESDLASVLRFNGDLAGAEELLRQSYDTNVKTRGAEHPNTAAALHDLALIAAMRGDPAAAEPLLRQALQMQRQSLGNHHPVVASTLNSLSRVLLEKRHYDEAIAVEREAAAIAASSLGPDHQLVAIYTVNLAAVHAAAGRYADAEPLLREGLRIRSLAPGIVPTRRRTRVEDDWSVGATRSLLGEVLTRLGRFPEAEATLLDARRDLESLPAMGGAEMKIAYSRLVDLYFAWGRPEHAAAFRALLRSR